ncbi:hypothetical protein P2D89_21215 [Agrobacterium rhizogenes]|uniref:hypothetical protein n=1 Tax=Rhizobium rhizogenes TaxID=359 RepID=UPI0028651A95|nr:hypothetical protein [Rhizobium rhizogenes]MDF1891522.1 hypothetical protein [Rhizobium rhizogenes]
MSRTQDPHNLSLADPAETVEPKTPPTDPAIEKWLCEQVVPAYDAHKAFPEKAVALDEAMAKIRVCIERRSPPVT